MYIMKYVWSLSEIIICNAYRDISVCYVLVCFIYLSSVMILVIIATCVISI